MTGFRWSMGVVVLTGLFQVGCASMEQLVNTPDVRLRQVQVQSIDVAAQSFLLTFDVTNPNPFPLPISVVSYAVALDGHPFASGNTDGSFTVPARGDGEFVISVDLNLLRTAPELMFIAREGFRRDLAYTLKGELGIDLPYAKPVAFATDGHIRLQPPGN